MSVVVDASVTLDWFFKSERTAYGNRVLKRALREGCLEPFLWPSEVAHGLLKGVRRQELRAEEARQALELLRAIDARVDQPDWRSVMSRLYALAEEHQTTAYDAAYLELASRLKAPLATKNAGLRRAARHERVSLFEG